MNDIEKSLLSLTGHVAFPTFRKELQRIQEEMKQRIVKGVISETDLSELKYYRGVLDGVKAIEDLFIEAALLSQEEKEEE